MIVQIGRIPAILFSLPDEAQQLITLDKKETDHLVRSQTIGSLSKLLWLRVRLEVSIFLSHSSFPSRWKRRNTCTVKASRASHKHVLQLHLGFFKQVSGIVLCASMHKISVSTVLQIRNLHFPWEVLVMTKQTMTNARLARQGLCLLACRLASMVGPE